MTDGRIGGPETTEWARPVGFARSVITFWALLGGFILVALILLTAVSAVSRIFSGRSIPGDYDLARHGVAIAIFSFLPYAQLTFANVTVDVFTERASGRAKAAMALLASLLAAALAVLLAWRMWYGMWDSIAFREAMISIRLPVWTAYPPALVSLALLFVASLITAWQGVVGVRTGSWTN
jgi:TRAP-type C4-dicarboxylate transport system permease small subunit